MLHPNTTERTGRRNTYKRPEPELTEQEIRDRAAELRKKWPAAKLRSQEGVTPWELPRAEGFDDG